MDRPVKYLQTDPRWRGVVYSSQGDASQTIGTSGCGPACAAMVIATLRDKTITPVETCAWAVKHGYRTANNGTAFDYFTPQLAAYGIPATYTWDKAAAEAALKAGKMVIGRALKGRWTSGGHYILGYGADGGRVLVNDPNSTRASREKAPLAAWRAEVAPYWIIQEEWNMTVKNLEIEKDGKLVTVAAVHVDGSNYIKLRDVEKLAAVTVDYDAARRLPVITAAPAAGNQDVLRGWLRARLAELDASVS